MKRPFGNPVVQLGIESVIATHGLPRTDKFMALEARALKSKTVLGAIEILGEVAALGYSMGYDAKEVKGANLLFDAIAPVSWSKTISGSVSA